MMTWQPNTVMGCPQCGRENVQMLIPTLPEGYVCAVCVVHHAAELLKAPENPQVDLFRRT